MTFTEAAVEVLRLAGKPLHFKDITQMAIEKNLLSHVGKTPDVTMGSRLSAQIAKYPDGPIVRQKSGVYALREWEGGKAKKKKKGAEAEVEPVVAEPEVTEAAPEEDDNADQPSRRPSRDRSRDDKALEKTKARAQGRVGPAGRRGRRAPRARRRREDARRARGQRRRPVRRRGRRRPAAVRRSGARAGRRRLARPVRRVGGRRRRRRRRRGKRDEGGAPGQTFGGPTRVPRPSRAPSTAGDDEEETIGVTIGDERDEQPTRRAIVLERVPQQQQGRGNQGGGKQQDFRAPGFQRSGNFDLSASPALEGTEPIDELAGRELSDLIVRILEGVDRNQGAVPFRAIAEAAQRRGRVVGDVNGATSAIAAAVRGDNLRRAAQGQRPRFRLANGGRVALTDWSLGSDLLRLEQEAVAALDRYRDAARRMLAGKLQKDISGPALVELLLIALERLGFRDIKPVRRAGLPGGESHFSAVHVSTGGEEIRTAIVLRRDGREIGRERVIDLRGSLHHYGGGSGQRGLAHHDGPVPLGRARRSERPWHRADHAVRQHRLRQAPRGERASRVIKTRFDHAVPGPRPPRDPPRGVSGRGGGSQAPSSLLSLHSGAAAHGGGRRSLRSPAARSVHSGAAAHGGGRRSLRSPAARSVHSGAAAHGGGRRSLRSPAARSLHSGAAAHGGGRRSLRSPAARSLHSGAAARMEGGRRSLRSPAARSLHSGAAAHGGGRRSLRSPAARSVHFTGGGFGTSLSVRTQEARSKSMNSRTFSCGVSAAVVQLAGNVPEPPPDAMWKLE